MGRAERQKGLRGEREVRALYEAEGLEVRGLEAGGDHAVICGPGGELAIHSEVKRRETTKPWEWFAQAEAEAPAGAIATVTFRRSRSPWLALLRATELARLLRLASSGRAELAEAGNALADELEARAYFAIDDEARELAELVAAWDRATGVPRSA